MLIAVENTIQAMQAVVQSIGVGTNLALLQLMWSMMQGTMLGSRGAIFPALIASGFRLETARRSWAAMRYGSWQIDELVGNWSSYVRQQEKWQEHKHQGYRAVAVDLTAFWRPKLKSKWLGKHFHTIAGRALAAMARGETVGETLVEPLSDRETEVLRLLAQGLTNKDMAQTLILSVRTIEAHLRNIFGKLGVTSRTEAALWATKYGYGPED